MRRASTINSRPRKLRRTTIKWLPLITPGISNLRGTRIRTRPMMPGLSLKITERRKGPI